VLQDISFVEININLVDESSHKVQVDSWTCVKDVIEMLAQHYGLQKSNLYAFGLFHVTHLTIHHKLYSTERILDIYAHAKAQVMKKYTVKVVKPRGKLWNAKTLEKITGVRTSQLCKLLFKAYLHMDFDEREAEINMMYLQVRNES